jgi:3-phosphoshikimate 1-carboxyvinyltransferase
MSTITIHPSSIKGTLQAPPSKSCMQRACAAALLKGGKTIIKNYGSSNDDKAAIEIIKQFGTTVVFENTLLHINSTFNNQHSKIEPQSPININCNESGLSLRMFTPIAALFNETAIITGSGSLLNRPILFFSEVFPQLNVSIETNNGKLPIKINGVLHAENIEIDGSTSSQFLTGLLFAYSASSSLLSKTIIKVNNLKSKPYIDLTLQVMKDFGLNMPMNVNYEEFIFQPSIQPPCQIVNYTIEGDWSNAAFLLVAGAIAGSITLTELNINSTQADKAILTVLESCGCSISYSQNTLTINKSNVALFNFTFDATDCPDLFPPLVALAAYCIGTTRIKGISRLTHKESNRANTLQQEFNKMGVEIILQDDTMIIKGNGKVFGANVDSHNDHRIAMACAVAALQATGSTSISNADAIDKSYPDFFKDVRKVTVN